MKITVLVTTYGRKEYLRRCVESLTGQERPPDEVVLVTRDADQETNAYVDGLTGGGEGPVCFRNVRVSEPGVLPANRAGLPLVTGEILCFLDDDAAARPDWIRRIEKMFMERPDVGAYGGRDLQHTDEGIRDEPADRAGRILWYGRILGDHHKRVPGIRNADALKGCNMAYRRELVTGFDEGILGHAHYYEMDLCFAVKRAGYAVLYDGDLVVDHYVNAPRFLAASAGGRDIDPDWYFYMHHNRVYVMMKNLPPVRSAVFLAYTFLGDAAAALAHRVRRTPMGRAAVIGSIFRGKMAGLRRHRGNRKTVQPGGRPSR